MHEQFPRNLEEKLVDNEDSYRWLKFGDIKEEAESTIFAAQDRTVSRDQLKCDGTRSETRFRLSVKRTSLFKSAGASVQSTTGSRGVRISFYCW